MKLAQQQYSLDHIPTLFVATKSDLDLALQVGFVFAAKMCTESLA